MRKISLLIITVFFCQSVFATTYAAPDISPMRSELRKSMQTQYGPVKHTEKEERITRVDTIIFYAMNVFTFFRLRILNLYHWEESYRQKGYWFLRRAEYFYKKGGDEKYRESMHKAFYWFDDAIFGLFRGDRHYRESVKKGIPHQFDKDGADSRFMRALSHNKSN